MNARSYCGFGLINAEDYELGAWCALEVGGSDKRELSSAPLGPHSLQSFGFH